MDPSAHTVDEAIARVIAAERDARESIAQAQSRAAALVEDARAVVRALEARTERRIGAVRAAFERRTRAAVAALDGEAAALGAEPALSNADLAEVERAVTALAAALTTGEV